jgi:MFS family permease
LLIQILTLELLNYLTKQILAGVLAQKFGSKIMLFIGMFFGSLMTMLVPVAAASHFAALFTVRFLNGIANSFFMPGMSALWYEDIYFH